MPSKKYNLVQNPGDDLDSRIPLVPDEAFQHGINFNVKFIGAMDIPRPTSRVEIVAAMRRVRFEFKSKGIKKRKVSVTVSTEGIRTSIRKKTKGRKKQQLNVPEIIVESHPIYRIFYVSHDSQDVKIFSYIARETSSSVFHCVVFKASNKNQAMKIVRTVGQAFEVCHKVSGPYESSDIENQESSNKERESSHVDDSTKSKKLFESKLKPGNSPQKKIPPPIHVINQVEDREFDKEELIESHKQQLPSTPILKEYSNVHEIKLLREKYEQATQATNAALAQVSLLRDQLQAESNARIEAQARTHQLLQHNKELLDHLQSLVHHIQELEGNARQSSSSCSISPTPLPQVLTSFQEIDALRRQNAALLETILYENNRMSYPHYFIYPPPPPTTPYNNSLYNNLLINNPHIPYQTPQTNSNSSSPSKFYEDFNTIFNRPPPASTSAPNVDVGASSIMKPMDNPNSRFLFEPQSSSGSGRKPNNNNGVQRSVSEKVNHRSELMREVQRSVWARHTTK